MTQPATYKGWGPRSTTVSRASGCNLFFIFYGFNSLGFYPKHPIEAHGKFS